MFKKFAILFFLLLSLGLRAQNFKFGKVSKMELEEKEHTLEPNADAAILYSYQRTYYDFNKHEGFKLISEYHRRIKIYKKEGFDWATKKIIAYQAGRDEKINKLKAVTYNLENGKIKETKLGDDQVFTEKESKYRTVTKFTMPAVTEGSVIEYQYSIESEALGAIDKIALQYSIPINKILVNVTIPEYLQFGVYNNPKADFHVQVDQSNVPFKESYRTTSRSSKGGMTYEVNSNMNTIEFNQISYSIDEENIPSLVQENHIDYLSNYAAFLDWELKFTKFPGSTLENYSQSWEGVSKTIFTDDGYSRELNNTKYFEDEVAALLQGVSNPMHKLALIYNFVKEKVKWNDFVGYHAENGLKTAYKEGSGNTGDINLLLISILNFAKIDANPVLLSTQDNGIPVYPTRKGLNYVIAQVNIGEETILLDATDPYAGPGELPERARNWQGRIIKEDGSSDWINLQPGFYSEDLIRMNVKLSEKEISGKFIDQFNGFHAKKFRMNNKSIESFKSSLERNYADLRISELKIKNLKNPGEEITLSYDFQSVNGKEVIGDMVYFKPLFFRTMDENPFKAEERKYPIFFNFPLKNRHLVNIMIPDGFEVESIPESVIITLPEDGAGEYRFIINHNGQFIRLESELNLTKIVFSPSDYEMIQSFFSDIIKKQNESIVLKKIKTDGLNERTESGR